MNSKLKESNKKSKGGLVLAASTNDENPPDKVGQEATTSNGSNQFPFSQLEKLLTCPICLDRYKQPKLLPCQHTYCLECLENMADYYRRIVKCAECRTENILPYKGVETFPNNLTILSFLELPSVIAVEEMKNGNNNLLLLQQKNNHQNNDLQNQQRFLNQGSNPPLASTQQSQQQYRFIKLESCPICGENAELTRCLHCERKLCTECKDSHTEQLQREVLRLLTNTQKNVPKLEETIQVIEQKLANMKNNFNFVKNEIKMEIERCIRELNNRERVLLEEVDNLMESEIRKMTERQGTLSGEKEEIDSYCQLVANRLNPNATYETSTAIKAQRSRTLNVLGSDRSVSTSPETNDDEEGPRQSNVETSLNLLEDSDETQDHLNQEHLSQAVASIDVNIDEDRPITEEELIGLKQQIGTYLEHIRDINVEAVESYKRMKFIADNNMLRSNILTFGELHVRSVVHSGSKSEGPSASGASLGYRTSSQDNDDNNDILEENTGTRRGFGGVSPSEKSGPVQRNVNSRFLASSRNRYEPSPSNDTSSIPSRRSTQASSSANHENIFSGYLGNEVTPGPTASHSNKSWRTDSMNRPIQQSGKFNELDSNRLNYGSKTNLKNKKISTDPPFGRNLMRSKTTLNLEYMDSNKYQNYDTRYMLDDDEITYKYEKSSNNRIYKAPLKKYDLCKSNLPISENNTNKSICYPNQKDNNLSNTNLRTPSNLPNLLIIENAFHKNRPSNLDETFKPVGCKVLKKLEQQDANNIEEIKLGLQNCSNGKSDTIPNDLCIDAHGDHWWKAWLIDEGEVKTRAEKKVEELKANKNTTDLNEETINSSKINKVVRGDAKNNITKRLPSFSRMMPASSVEHLQNPPIKLRMEQKRRQTKMDLLSDRSQLASNERRVSISKAMIKIPEYLNFESSKTYNLDTPKKHTDVTSFETDYQGENNFCCNISHPAIHNSSEVNKTDPMLIINEKMGKDKETDRKMAESIRNKFNTLQRFKRRNEFLLNLASLSVLSTEESNATPNYVPIRERIQNLKNSNVVQPISSEGNEQKSSFANFENQSSIPNDPYEGFRKSRRKQDIKNSDNNNPKSKNNFDKSLPKVSADKSDDFDNLKKCLSDVASQNEQLLLEQIFDNEFKTYINEIQNLNLNISNNSSNEIFSDVKNMEDRYDTPNGSILGESEYTNNHNVDNIFNEDALESDNKFEDIATNLSSSDKEDNAIEKEALNQTHPKYKRSHSILIKHEPKSYESSGICSENENFENGNKTSDIISKVGLIYTYQKDYNQDTKTSLKSLNRKKSSNDGVSASLQIRVNPTPYKFKKNEMLNAITPDEVVTQHPMGMALLKCDSHYSLVVTEKEAHRIAFLDLSPSWTQGRRKLKDEDISHYYGTFGYSHEKLNQPCDVTVGLGGQIAIADWGNNKVICLDQGYSFERIIGTGEKGHLKGQFDGPTGLTFDTMGFIYVCDKGNRRVQVFSGDGIYVGKWGANHLVEPKRIYHSQEKSIIYVSDVGDHSVKLFDRNGIKIRTVSGIQKEFTASTYNVVVNSGSCGDIWRPEKFKYPSSLATYFSNGTISENIVLLDSGNWRAVILSPDGQVIETYPLLDDSTIKSKNPGRLDSCLSLPPNIGLFKDDEIPKFLVSNKLNNKLIII